MQSIPVLCAFSSLCALYLVYRRYTRISVSHIPGPEPVSFLLGIDDRISPCYLGLMHTSCSGNLPEIFQSQAGVPDFKYQRQFGDVVRVKGPFGVGQVSLKGHISLTPKCVVCVGG